MKRAVAAVMIVCLLSGCNAADDSLAQAMELRSQILNGEKCTFQAVVTADYGNALYTFQMEYEADGAGNLSFTVTDPETIRGITGHISQDGAGLTFDDKVLAFPLLADGQLTPVSAPWLFLNSIRSGYLSGTGRTDDGNCIYIDDSFGERPIRTEIFTDENNLPYRADIIWQDRRVLSVDIQNFSIQ